MTRKTLQIGRSQHADIVIADAGVAALHAELVVTSDGRIYVTDRGGEDGTFLRAPGADWSPLRQGFVEDGEELRFGSFAIPVAALRRRAAEATDDGPVGQGGYGGRPVQQIRGAVERDPATGEIVKRKF
jgi:predicted component of type VI protein secretion system